MALETLTFDFNITFFPVGLDFIAASEDNPLEMAGPYSHPESLSAAKKALDEDDEFEDDDDEEEEDDEYEDDDDEDDDDDDDDEEDDDEEDDDVDELQVGRRR